MVYTLNLDSSDINTIIAEYVTNTLKKSCDPSNVSVSFQTEVDTENNIEVTTYSAQVTGLSISDDNSASANSSSTISE